MKSIEINIILKHLYLLTWFIEILSPQDYCIKSNMMLSQQNYYIKFIESIRSDTKPAMSRNLKNNRDTILKTNYANQHKFMTTYPT